MVSWHAMISLSVARLDLELDAHTDQQSAGAQQLMFLEKLSESPAGLKAVPCAYSIVGTSWEPGYLSRQHEGAVI